MGRSPSLVHLRGHFHQEQHTYYLWKSKSACATPQPVQSPVFQDQSAWRAPSRHSKYHSDRFQSHMAGKRICLLCKEDHRRGRSAPEVMWHRKMAWSCPLHPIWNTSFPSIALTDIPGTSLALTLTYGRSSHPDHRQCIIRQAHFWPIGFHSTWYVSPSSPLRHTCFWWEAVPTSLQAAVKLQSHFLRNWLTPKNPY